MSTLSPFVTAGRKVSGSQGIDPNVVDQQMQMRQALLSGQDPRKMTAQSFQQPMATQSAQRSNTGMMQAIRDMLGRLGFGGRQAPVSPQPQQ